MTKMKDLVKNRALYKTTIAINFKIPSLETSLNKNLITFLTLMSSSLFYKQRLLKYSQLESCFT